LAGVGSKPTGALTIEDFTVFRLFHANGATAYNVLQFLHPRLFSGSFAKEKC
jgi:hypothetical protein